MSTVPKEFLQSLIKVLEWYQEAYCDPQTRTETSIYLERLIDTLCIEKDKTELTERYIILIKEAVESAMNYKEECGMPITDIEALRDWVWPLYKERKE